MLGAVQRLVGQGQQARHFIARSCACHHADTHAKQPRFKQRQAGEGLANLLGHLHRCRLINVGQQAGEFFTVDACKHILAVQGLREQLAEGDQGLVAGLMAKGVVDPFEMVQVAQQQRPPAAVDVGSRRAFVRFAP